jgi:hypothetical protein
MTRVRLFAPRRPRSTGRTSHSSTHPRPLQNGSADTGGGSFERPFTALRDRGSLRQSRPFGTMGQLIDEWTVGSAAVVVRSTGTQAG